MNSAVHLDDEQLAAAAEASGPQELEAAIAEHLGDCDDCRRRWSELRQQMLEIASVTALEQTPWELERGVIGDRSSAVVARDGRVWWLQPGLLAGALIIVGLALLIPWQLRQTDPGPVRSEPAAALLQGLRPEGMVSGDTIVFEWTSDPRATQHELIVADDTSGEIVLRIVPANSPRTLLAAEFDLIESGRTYVWFVRARHGVGRESTGPSHRFSWQPPSID